ncbi:MAG: hypothetical protein ACREXU_16515 [Gammaproteobacteria bacterium]
MGVEYARAFDTHAREQFAAKRPPRGAVPSLFTDREIDAFFREMVGAARGATVSQADFFDRLHLEADARRKQR